MHDCAFPGLHHSSLSTQLVLIFLTNILVILHSNDCRLVVWLWSPIHKCFARFRRQWDIQNSLVDAFATFFLLLLVLYVKFLNVSFDFHMPTILWDKWGQQKSIMLYYDGSVKYCIPLIYLMDHYPHIDMDVVLQYQPGKVIPQITMKMKWVGEGQPTEEEVPVQLTGVHAPKSFLLWCTPDKTTKVLSTWKKRKPDMHHVTLIRYQIHNKEREFRLLQKIQCKWYNIGLLLDVPLDTIDSRKMDEEKCQDVLRMWMDNGSSQYPVDWASLIKVLQEVQMGTVAEDLEEALDNEIV